MPVELKAGAKMRSAVCSHRGDRGAGTDRAGRPRVRRRRRWCRPARRRRGGAVDPARADGTLLGKRYVHDAAGLEVLCTKAGDGSLSVGWGDPAPEGRQGRCRPPTDGGSAHADPWARTGHRLRGGG